MFIPIWFILRPQAEEMRQRNERLAQMLKMLNAPGVEELSGEDLQEVFDACHRWVGQQVNAPESASFRDERIRRHPDGPILVAGSVESANVIGSRCRNWYVVEIDAMTGEAGGDVIDFDPVTVTDPVRFCADDGRILRYATPNEDEEVEKGYFWPIFWAAVILVLAALLLIPYLLN